MADDDPRQWPGFRYDPPKAIWERGSGPGDGIRAAETDPTYPKAVISAQKTSTFLAKKALEAVTPVEAKNRAALANGECNDLPQHKHVLAQTLRFVPGGRTTALAYIQRAARNRDPDAQAWWKIFADLLPSHQKHVDFDDVCEASGVTPDRLMAVVVSTAMRAGADAADMVAATMQPSIVRQTVRSALRIGGQFAAIGQKDRELMLQHYKFVPSPRGVNVSVNANANAQAAAAAASQPSVPTFSDSLEGAMDAHREVQGELIDAEFEEA